MSLPDYSPAPSPGLSLEETAELLRVSVKQVARWTQRREDPLPTLKVGRRYRFYRPAVLAWWERQTA